MERLQGADVRAGGGLLQSGPQGADAAFQAGAVRRLAGQGLPDGLDELPGASAVRGAAGGGADGEQVGA